jgi:hypothetical protein
MIHNTAEWLFRALGTVFWTITTITVVWFMIGYFYG